MDDLIIKAIIAAEPSIKSAYIKDVTYKTTSSCFEIFGFDILIDNSYNPWLIEINLSPSFTCDSPLDQKIKGELVAESLDVISKLIY